MTEEVGQLNRVFRSKVDDSGRIVLPAALRKQFGVAPGDVVTIVLDETGLRIQTFEQTLRAVQEYVCKLIPDDVSLADELIAERRSEAERE